MTVHHSSHSLPRLAVIQMVYRTQHKVQDQLLLAFVRLKLTSHFRGTNSRSSIFGSFLLLHLFMCNCSVAVTLCSAFYSILVLSP